MNWLSLTILNCILNKLEKLNLLVCYCYATNCLLGSNCNVVRFSYQRWEKGVKLGGFRRKKGKKGRVKVPIFFISIHFKHKNRVFLMINDDWLWWKIIYYTKFLLCWFGYVVGDAIMELLFCCSNGTGWRSPELETCNGRRERRNGSIGGFRLQWSRFRHKHVNYRPSKSENTVLSKVQPI